MAFWGIEVKPGRPFTHKHESTKGRLHISQATLGIGTAILKSTVQCNVGNRSPVFLCSLFPEKTESLQLNVEFEEGEEVLFSVIGPRSVHLTGHYVGGGRHFLANDESESYGVDIADTETERSDHSDEDTYEDSFIDDNDPTISLSSPVSDDGVEVSKKKKPKKAKSKKRRLKKKYQMSESDDDNCLQQDPNVVPLDESEKEDFFTISSLCKPKTNLIGTNIEAKDKVDEKASKTDYKTQDEPIVKSIDIEVKDKVDEKASKTDYKTQDEPILKSIDIEVKDKVDKITSDTDIKIKDADDSVKDPIRETGYVEVENEAKRSSTKVATDVDQGNVSVSKKKKKKTKGANCTNTPKEDQTPQDEPNAEKKDQILSISNEHLDAVRTQEADQLGNTFVPATEADPGNVVKSNKKKRRRQENVTAIVDANHISVVEEDNEQIKQGNDEKVEAPLNLSLVASDVGSVNGAKRKKKRKEQAKGQSTPEADNIQDSNVIKEDNNKQVETLSDKIAEDFHASDKQSQKHANILNCDNEVDQLPAENQPKKKKKRTKVIVEKE